MANKYKFHRKSLAIAVTAACMTMTGMPRAQDTGASTLEEVLVTATRRETSVQDIPYNISVLSGEAMELQNIVNQWELLRSVHGVSVVDRGYRNAGTVNSIVIRGLNVDNGANGDIMLNAVPTVATYVDNTPLFANFVLKDIDRVEVLRGPQGTLYGSGSLGGTVRYISNKPSAEGIDGSIDVDYGTTDGSSGDNINIDGMINIPLGDRAAIRANVGRIDNDGIIDYVNAYQLNDFREPLINVGGNCVDPRNATDDQVLNNVGCFENVKDADDVTINYYKISLLAEVSDTLSVQATYQGQDDKIGARRSTTLGNNGQPAGSPLFFEYGDDDSGQLLLEPSSRHVDLGSVEVEWDLGFATFTSNSSYYDHEGVGESDNGGLWASGGRDWNFLFYGGNWARPAQRAERGHDDEAFIQEVRLVSNEPVHGFDWLVGAFYMDQDTSVYQLSHNPGMNLYKNACRATADPLCTTGGIYGGFWPRFYAGDLSEIDFEYIRDTAYEEVAIYGELTYHFTDTLRVTGGFRWFDNKTINDTILGFPLPPGSTSPSAPQSRDSDNDVLLKFNISWDLNDQNMVYGTYSEGYRHGGAQAVPSLANGDPFGEPNAEAIRTFQADSVKNYELGLKGRWENMTYGASLFYVDWNNPQLNTTSSFFGFYLAANGDEASTQGVELELEGQLRDSIHYRVGYTYVDAELEKDFISPQTGAVVASKGATLPGAPSHVLSLALDNTWNVNANMDLIASVNGYFQDDSQNFINQTSVLNETFDSFWLWGASVRLVSEHWTATLYAKNLGNEAGPTGSFPCSYWCQDTGTFENWYGNGNRQFITQPRTFGLSVGYRY